MSIIINPPNIIQKFIIGFTILFVGAISLFVIYMKLKSFFSLFKIPATPSICSGFNGIWSNNDGSTISIVKNSNNIYDVTFYKSNGDIYKKPGFILNGNVLSTTLSPTTNPYLESYTIDGNILKWSVSYDKSLTSLWIRKSC